MGGRGLKALKVGDAFDAGVIGFEQFVRSVLDPLGDIDVCGAAVGGVVFEAAVFGGIVGGGDDDAVGEVVFAVAVVGEDGVGDDRCGGEAVVLLNDGFDAVGGEHFEGGLLRGGRGGVGVLAHVERAGDVVGFTIIA